MKKDISNTIDLDKLFESSNKHAEPTETVLVVEEQKYVDFGRILNEVSYKLPKGYPTVVDGVFTEREEIIIINEALEAEGLPTLPLPEAGKVKRIGIKLPQPDVGNDTSLKEGLVCLMYDSISNGAFEKIITTTQQNNLKTKQQVDPKTIQTIYEKLKSVFNTNSKRYGATESAPGEDSEDAASMPKNLPEYVKWAYESNDETAIQTVNNGLSAAKAIVANVGRGIIIRNNEFEAIRTRAVLLGAQAGIPRLKPDNWCPGDVYILMPGADIDAAKKATKLSQLNKLFSKKTKIVACSLKEQLAQAGKATEFIKNVFTKEEYVAPISQKNKFGTSSNKQTAALSSNIKRFQQYIQGFGRRKQSYIEAIVSVDKTTGKYKPQTSINNILRAAGYDNDKINKFKASIKYDSNMSSDSFYKTNKKLFNEINNAIDLVKGQLSDNKPKIEAQFIKSREEFLKLIEKYDVTATGANSKTTLQGVYTKAKNPLEIISKKTATYELATLIMNKWMNRKGVTSDAYEKLISIKNPFAALTAFAIAEAGISPSFWKIIGNDTEVMGEAHWFVNDATVSITTSKTSKITLADSYESAGFTLDYVTVLGKDKYNTKLSFRFADTAIRIEIQKLVKL